MNNKKIKMIGLVVVILIVMSVILNACPQLENQLHQITGWQ